MRRGVASLIIALSLVVASLSWAGFTLSNTILDPGRSERLATQLLDNPEVREALIGRMADALETQIPPEVPVPRAAIETGAAVALDDPRVEALVVDGFVRVHQNALEGNAEPVVIDAGALGAAGRDALVDTRPELDAVLPAVPPLNMELPTTGLSWLGQLKQLVDRYTRLGALAALFGLSVAFVVTKDRGSVFRKVAFWGYGASAFWIALGYGIPRAAAILSPRSAAIASAVVDVFFGAMVRPAVIMAIIATVLLIIGFAWPALAGQRAARVAQPARRPTGGGMGPPIQQASAEPVLTAPTEPAGGRLTPTRRPITDTDLIGGAGPIRTETWTPVGSTDQTEQMPTVGGQQAGAIGEQQSTTRWQPGQGYVDDPDQPISPFDRQAEQTSTRRFQP